ncbi:MAG TPA: zinc ribbon domain-containing protein [Candidatus Angelobacter sp.]|nr:zinc ribbon domain-containing protein [Candidatus Angelobacter sp.]
MTCIFCSTENRPENRFCGACGVLLERRRAARKSNQEAETLCPFCGNVNERGYKFCGQCGARMERRAQENSVPIEKLEDAPRAAAKANAQLPAPESSREQPRGVTFQSREMPVHPPLLNMPKPPPKVPPISGPSFLGLNSSSENDSTYLLEDADEERSRGGLRKWILLAILAVVGVLAYLQWRSNQQMISNLLASFNPSPPLVPAPQPTHYLQSLMGPMPQVEDQAALGRDAEQTIDLPQTETKAESGPTLSTPKNRDDDVKNQAGVGASKPVSSNGQETAKQHASDGSVVEEVSRTAEADAKKDNGSASHRRSKDDAEDRIGGNSEPATAERRRPSAALIKAQRYLQGRGMPRNCEQGMVYLKAATEQEDPNAAVQMAALYASGSCVRQDRLKAYQWFTRAHALEPSNTWIEKNMNQLWAQMTSSERQQITR